MIYLVLIFNFIFINNSIAMDGINQSQTELTMNAGILEKLPKDILTNYLTNFLDLKSMINFSNTCHFMHDKKNILLVNYFKNHHNIILNGADLTDISIIQTEKNKQLIKFKRINGIEVNGGLFFDTVNNVFWFGEISPKMGFIEMKDQFIFGENLFKDPFTKSETSYCTEISKKYKVNAIIPTHNDFKNLFNMGGLNHLILEDDLKQSAFWTSNFSSAVGVSTENNKEPEMIPMFQKFDYGKDNKTSDLYFYADNYSTAYIRCIIKDFSKIN